jgi:hypothetical protein
VTTRKGYQGVFLVNIQGQKAKRLYVHRLVAEAFLGLAPEGRPEVNHKNSVRTDNRIENLEWVSHSENIRHAIANGELDPRHTANRARGERAPKAKLTAPDVVKIRAQYALRRSYHAIAVEFGVGDATVRDIVKGYSWAHVPQSA